MKSWLNFTFKVDMEELGWIKCLEVIKFVAQDAFSVFNNNWFFRDLLSSVVNGEEIFYTRLAKKWVRNI